MAMMPSISRRWTFTNKAALEMQERIAKLLKEPASQTADRLHFPFFGGKDIASGARPRP